MRAPRLRVAAAAALATVVGATTVGDSAERATSGPRPAATAGVPGAATGSLRSSEAGSRPRAGTPPDSLIAGPFVVRFWPEHAPLARRAADAAPALSELPALPAGWWRDGGRIRIDLAPTAEAFQELAGGRAPEWSGGVAFPAAGVIVLPLHTLRTGSPAAFRRVLRHELAHIGLHRALDGARTPRWFDEGYARWASGDWDWEAAWQLRLAFALRRAPPLDSLALAWPADATDARIAYLLSASAVAFLVEQSGERGLRVFLERWAAGDGMDEAFRRTFGLTLGQFEEHWRRDVQRRYGWAFFFSHTLVFWFFAGVLLLVLFARRRQRDRARLEALRATEPPDTPAYWLGEDEPAGSESVPSGPPRPDPERAPGVGGPGGAGARDPGRSGSRPD